MLVGGGGLVVRIPPCCNKLKCLAGIIVGYILLWLMFMWTYTMVSVHLLRMRTLTFRSWSLARGSRDMQVPVRAAYYS
jgi:xanthine/uracil permease